MKKYSLFELENTTLRQLDLNGDRITDVGAIALSENTTVWKILKFE
jgi:hypothetical protein